MQAAARHLDALGRIRLLQSRQVVADRFTQARQAAVMRIKSIAFVERGLGDFVDARSTERLHDGAVMRWEVQHRMNRLARSRTKAGVR